MPVKEGFVPTPPAIADWLAAEVLLRQPDPGDRILYPGAGTGRIAAGVHRRCSYRDLPVPDAVAVERNAERAQVLEERFVDPDAPMNHGTPELDEDSRWIHKPYRGTTSEAAVSATFDVHVTDFLRDPPAGPFDYIVANPPYLAYKDIPSADREAYADTFDTAQGQFDLYVPFIEQMLDLLSADGLLAFLAPVRYLTTDMAGPLRNRLRQFHPYTPELVPDVAFPNHKVETVVTTVSGCDSDVLGSASPNDPQDTRLRLTHIEDPFWSCILGSLGVDLDNTSDLFKAYVERKRSWKSRVRRLDKQDRDLLDAQVVNHNEQDDPESRQSALTEGWT